MIVSRLAHVEVSSAIVRQGYAAGLESSIIEATLAEIDADFSELLEVIELSRPLLSRALQLARRHRLRAADSIQLASVFEARELTQADEFVVVCCDVELNGAARAEQMAVLDPSQP